MKILEKEFNPLGLGCWPGAGAMYAPDGRNLGYSNSSDVESKKAIQAAVANGITVFDTAAAYGAGHSERLLGSAIGNDDTCMVITKIGIGIDEVTKKLSFDKFKPDQVPTEIDNCLKRLNRDCIDLLMLHLNSMPVSEAASVFDAMERVRVQGKIKAYGWSTDFSGSVKAMDSKPGFIAVEHAMNTLLDAPKMQKVVTSMNLHALIRSPLAMGLLSGKYDQTTRLNSNDVRAGDEGWLQYFKNGAPNPVFLERFHAIRELLQSDGRSTIQGALCWLWAKHPNNVPIPGARTVEQVEHLAATLQFKPLSESVVQQIEDLIDRNHAVDEEEREK